MMPEDELKQAIRTLFTDHMMLQIGSDDEDLIQSGALDSLRLVELLIFLEDRFGLRIAMEDLEIEDLRSVAAIARTVERLRSQARAEFPAEIETIHAAGGGRSR
jgi:acyl carrier protein